MTDKDAQPSAAPGPDIPESKPARAHEHFVSPGAESTRELREMARRRREAEEKLQQHLQEAHHLHEAKEKPSPGKSAEEKQSDEPAGEEPPAD